MAAKDPGLRKFMVLDAIRALDPTTYKKLLDITRADLHWGLQECSQLRLRAFYPSGGDSFFVEFRYDGMGIVEEINSSLDMLDLFDFIYTTAKQK